MKRSEIPGSLEARGESESHPRTNVFVSGVFFSGALLDSRSMGEVLKPRDFVNAYLV